MVDSARRELVQPSSGGRCWTPGWTKSTCRTVRRSAPPAPAPARASNTTECSKLSSAPQSARRGDGQRALERAAAGAPARRGARAGRRRARTEERHAAVPPGAPLAAHLEE